MRQQPGPALSQGVHSGLTPEREYVASKQQWWWLQWPLVSSLQSQPGVCSTPQATSAAAPTIGSDDLTHSRLPLPGLQSVSADSLRMSCAHASCLVCRNKRKVCVLPADRWYEEPGVDEAIQCAGLPLHLPAEGWQYVAVHRLAHSPGCKCQGLLGPEVTSGLGSKVQQC